MSYKRTLTINGYEPGTVCEHCGRRLEHGVRTVERGTIGADCFNKLIAPDRKRFGGNGKPGASVIRKYAMIRDRVSDAGLSRYGMNAGHFNFVEAA